MQPNSKIFDNFGFKLLIGFDCNLNGWSRNIRIAWQKQSAEVLLKISQNSQESTYAKVSFFRVAVLRPAALLKNRLWHRCFPVNFAKFLGTHFSIEQLFFGFYFRYGSKSSKTLLSTIQEIKLRVFIFRNALLKKKSLVISLEASLLNVIIFIYSVMEVQETLPPYQYRHFVLCYVLYY